MAFTQNPADGDGGARDCSAWRLYDPDFSANRRTSQALAATVEVQAEMDFHPAAGIFPMLGEDRLAELARDIAENGLREPILLLDGKVIDGRNRYRACEIAGVTPQFSQVPEGTNPWAFVWSLNGQRRDLSEDQRYIIWKECAENDEAWKAEQKRIVDEANKARSDAAKAGKVGRASVANKDEADFSAATTCSTTKDKLPTPEAKPKTRRGAQKKAESANVNAGTVARIDNLQKNRPDLFEKVRAGELTSSKAYTQAKKDTRKQDISDQREAITSGEASLPEGVFEVVVMDPPWEYGIEYDPETNRAPPPYPTMTQAELLEMEPPFADNAVLFLWTTNQFIWDAKALMDHWGFAYKAVLVWDKERMGMGRWFRMQCEFCLFGIKGKPTWENTTWRTLIREPRREHSRKPEVFYQMVEDCTVGRRLEMFSRQQRAGWGAHGNETQKFNSPADLVARLGGAS